MESARQLLAAEGSGFTTHDLMREANVALNTFYKHFGSKDQLLVAVVADMVRDWSAQLRAQAELLDGPLERLHLFVTAPLAALDEPGGAPRFITAEHWRLHQLFPDQMVRATAPYAELLREELAGAQATGLLAPRDPATDALLMARFILSNFHHHAFQLDDPRRFAAADDVWQFCLAAVSAPAGSAPQVERQESSD